MNQDIVNVIIISMLGLVLILLGFIYYKVYKLEIVERYKYIATAYTNRMK